MKQLYRILTVLAISGHFIAGQGQTTLQWQVLENAPFVSRYNDVFFVNPDTGWTVNGWGQIYRTGDGGDSWRLQFQKDATHFRSVGFLDGKRGWAGNVGFGEFGTTDTTILYQTTNGGVTWLPMNRFEGAMPAGLCGMHVLNDSSIFAVGRVRGPAFFAKTTDGGASWQARDLNGLAAGLIDVFFFNPDTGLAVGLSNSDHNQSSGLVLFTHDGGENWEKRFQSSRTGEWCWKVSFPTRQVGYASLQRNELDPIFILKTTDGGVTWQEKLFFDGYYFVQGIGFVNENEGWIGGNSSLPNYQTTDGGETWAPADFGIRMNRVRFLSDTLGYAAGRQVYKYSQVPVSAVNDPLPIAHTFALQQNYPNPFNPDTFIKFSLAQSASIQLHIFDLQGRLVRTLLDEVTPVGEHQIKWDGKNEAGGEVDSGFYFYRLTAGDEQQTRKMLLLR